MHMDLPERLKAFIKNTTDILKFRSNADADSIDRTHLLCVSMDNLILMVNSLKHMMADLDVKCFPLDSFEHMNAMGANLFYIKEGKEYSICLCLPFDFCNDEDIKKFNKWRTEGAKFFDGVVPTAVYISKVE